MTALVPPVPASPEPTTKRWAVLVVLDDPAPVRRMALFDALCETAGNLPFADDIDLMGLPLDEVPETAADYGR